MTKSLIILALLIVLASCGPSKEIKKHGHYLVTVETNKPKKLEPYRYSESAEVDSVVTTNFGHAIKEFSSDSIFEESPFFRIETLNKAVYGEQKRRGK